MEFRFHRLPFYRLWKLFDEIERTYEQTCGNCHYLPLIFDSPWFQICFYLYSPSFALTRLMNDKASGGARSNARLYTTINQRELEGKNWIRNACFWILLLLLLTTADLPCLPWWFSSFFGDAWQLNGSWDLLRRRFLFCPEAFGVAFGTKFLLKDELILDPKMMKQWTQFAELKKE